MTFEESIDRMVASLHCTARELEALKPTEEPTDTIDSNPKYLCPECNNIATTIFSKIKCSNTSCILSYTMKTKTEWDAMTRIFNANSVSDLKDEVE